MAKEPYDREGRLWGEVGDGPVEILPYSPPKFPEMDHTALEYLQQNGYVVLSGMASPDQIAEAEDIFWASTQDWYKDVKRTNVHSWTNENWECVANTASGVVSNSGSAHLPFMWYVRGLPKIKQAFANIWGDDDLLVSFDGYGVFRPPEVYGQTKNSWFHLDQNGYNKPGLHCVQGLLNLYPSGAEDGGLVVVPCTNIQFDQWFNNQMIESRKGDFIPLAKCPLKQWCGPDVRPLKLCLDPGDFVMWDSRTVHCSHPARILQSYPHRLRRLVAYICMTPCSKAADLSSLREKRVEAFNNGTTLNHWPHEFNIHLTDRSKKHQRHGYNPGQLTDFQKELIVGKSGKIEHFNL